MTRGESLIWGVPVAQRGLWLENAPLWVLNRVAEMDAAQQPTSQVH